MVLTPKIPRLSAQGARTASKELSAQDLIGEALSDNQKVTPFPAPHGWVVLAAVVLNSSFNAFLCMNFSACQEASAAALDITQDEASNFYSVYLFCCMAFMTPVMWQGERYERGALICSVLATMTAAWMRWYALYTMKFQYELCFISQVLVGFGACAISTLPGQISHQRFGPNRWALTTSLMLMGNYSGWLFGASVPTEFVLEGSVDSLRDLFFYQGIYSLLVAVGFFLLYRRLPDDAATIIEHENAQKSNIGGFVDVFRAMANTPQFTLQLLTHGFLGALGFVIPSAVLFIFKDLGSPDYLGSITNAIFIGTGVLGGIFLGAYSTDASSYPRTLKLCYVLGALSMIAMCFVAYSGLFHGFWADLLLVLLMSVAGFATLGFTGVLFEDLARFPNLNADYVLWIGYEIMLTISSTLNLFCANANGFWILAGTASVTCLTFLTCYRQAGAQDDSFGYKPLADKERPAEGPAKVTAILSNPSMSPA